MLTTTLLRRLPPPTTVRTPLRDLHHTKTGLDRLVRQPCLPRAFARSESTSTEAVAKKKSPYIYPALLNIYTAPTFHTMSIGMVRLTTLVAFAVGTLIYAPAVYIEGDAPVWFVPLAIAVSATPFSLALASGSLVTSVRVHLPSSARKSRDHLLAYASRPPGNAKVRLQFIRWKPWLNSKDVYLSDLRLLPPSRLRITNLEEVTDQSQKAASGLSAIRFGLQRAVNRYFVSVKDSGRERSGSVKGVWELLREKIPPLGSAAASLESKAEGAVERKAVGMRNRPDAGVGREGRAVKPASTSTVPTTTVAKDGKRMRP